MPRLRHTLLLLAAAAAVPAVLAGCSSSSVSGPTTARNSLLIAQLDTARAQADSNGEGNRAAQIEAIMQVLSVGSPVGKLTISIDGKAMGFNAAAALVALLDTTGTPIDSGYVLEAWRGTQADTIVALQYIMSSGLFNRAGSPGVSARRIFSPAPAPTGSPLALSRVQGAVSAQLSPTPPFALVGYFAGPSLWVANADSATASYQLTSLSGTCQTFALPSSVPTLSVASCEAQRATVSFTALAAPSDTLTTTGTHQLTMGASTISGVRVSFTP